PRLGTDATRDGGLGDQTGGDEYRGVRSVGARRDGRDRDRTITQVLGDARAHDLLGLAPERRAKRAARARERDTVLGTLGSGQAGFDAREVEFDVLGARGLDGLGVVPDALGLGVGLDE